MDMIEVLKTFGPMLGLCIAFIYSWGRLSIKVDDVIRRQDRFEGQILEELREIKRIINSYQLEMIRQRGSGE